MSDSNLWWLNVSVSRVMTTFHFIQIWSKLVKRLPPVHVTIATCVRNPFNALEATKGFNFDLNKVWYKLKSYTDVIRFIR